MKLLSKALCLLIVFFMLSCNSQKKTADESKIVYQSDDLIIKRLSENVYQHISYLTTETFGKVECNGMIVKDNNETIVFDTPTNDKSSAELIEWIKNDMHAKINAVVSTHFHDDCTGGLKEFNKNNISSYANNKTIMLAKENNLNVPGHGFDKELTINVGNEKVNITFFGEGHTRDNVIGYFPREKAMFGGCLIKEIDATKGYLGDANTNEWAATVEKLKKAYPDVKIVIPGHGESGGGELLDYTIKLFNTK